MILGWCWSNVGSSGPLSFWLLISSSMAYQCQEQGQFSPSEIQVQVLRGELDTANKKVDRYVHLGSSVQGTCRLDVLHWALLTVASLSEELDNLRRGICHNCKKKFVPFYAPITSSTDGSGPSPTLWHPTVSSRQTQTPSSGLPYVFPEITGGPSIPIRSTILEQNPIALSRPYTSSSATPIPTHPPTTPNNNEIQSEQAGWSVSHNPNIKQSLQIDLVNTFNYTASVFCLKFSPDGKYLGVGLDRRSGKTHIYDVEKGLKIWLAPS